MQLRLSGAQLEEKRQAETEIKEAEEILAIEEDPVKKAELVAEVAARQKKLDELMETFAVRFVLHILWGCCAPVAAPWEEGGTLVLHCSVRLRLGSAACRRDGRRLLAPPWVMAPSQSLPPAGRDPGGSPAPSTCPHSLMQLPLPSPRFAKRRR